MNVVVMGFFYKSVLVWGQSLQLNLVLVFFNVVVEYLDYKYFRC